MILNTKQILIVDDEEPILYILKNSLQKHFGDSCHIETATSGAAALEHFGQRRIDLVITDYSMDDMTGIELMEAIRDVQPDTRVILITAYGNDELEAKARQLQAYDYLTKPIEVSVLRKIVEATLEDRLIRSSVLIISEEHYQQIMLLLNQLKTDVRSRCIFLTNANGQIIAQAGSLPKAHTDDVASLLWGGMATLLEVGRTLDKDMDVLNRTYREGKHESLYALNIGQKWLLAIFVRHEPYSSRPGSVWYYAQQTTKTLRHILDEIEQAAPAKLFSEDIDGAFDTELDKLFMGNDLFETLDVSPEEDVDATANPPTRDEKEMPIKVDIPYDERKDIGEKKLMNLAEALKNGLLSSGFDQEIFGLENPSNQG